MQESLQQFHPVIGRWFEDRVGVPTPPQVMGWPEIGAGKSTLLLAPTGSGKTLAAFLVALDAVGKGLLAQGGGTKAQTHKGAGGGVEILYLSPLKSLANDVEKNLLRPLGELKEVAAASGMEWPEIRVGVRTGDTPQKARAAIARKPPHILITTPESLNLMLTSAARAVLAAVRYVIVDEVHALAGNKRGVFTSLLLERLEALRDEAAGPLVRVGLSATARPEEEIARWLGGYDDAGEARAVAICRAGQRKRLDLRVEAPFADVDPLDAADGAAGRSHWPQVVQRVRTLIHEHHSTLVFANSRRVVERLSARLLEGAEEGKDVMPILPHHGSISKEVRLETEQKLKRGELSAVIATSSLELGIDIGALDLVVQIDSPGSVAAALQRVGRAGHLEKATAKGRLLARRAGDLPALAAMIPLMFAGEVEETRIPQNCLDVLAQQIVAACAVLKWPRGTLWKVLRRAAPYHGLEEGQFDAVVAMLARKTRATAGVNTPGLRPKIAWDKVNDELIALPASARLAITNGGVIADTGASPVYLAGGGASTPRGGDRRVRIGELDEEFVYETREGDAIVLGSQAWQVVSIDNDRVIVKPAAKRGNIRMPFWRGETAPRSELLGQAVATFSRELEKRLEKEPPAEVRTWLTGTYHLDDTAADMLMEYAQRQSAAGGGGGPTDRRIVVEHFVDRTGEPVIAILCSLGSRVNYALRLALETRLSQEHLPAQLVHSDDGILIRPPGDGADFPGNPLVLLAPATLESLVVETLETTALFGIRFRQNATRALMLPRPNVAKRTPLWQQRLRARHLLAIVQQERNFPIVVETYRECMQDALHIDRARQVLADIAAGDVQVQVHRHTHPSPMAWSLFSHFQQEFQYAGEDPLHSGSAADATVDPAVIDAILQRRSPGAGEPAWSDEDVAALRRRITAAEYPARTGEELLEKIEAAGMVAAAPPRDACWRAWASADPEPMLAELFASRRLVIAALGPRDQRVLATESLSPLIAALGKVPTLGTYRGGKVVALSPDALPPALLRPAMTQADARRYLVEAALRREPMVTIAALAADLPFAGGDVRAIVQALLRAGQIVQLPGGEFALAEYVEQLRTLALRRQRHAAGIADLPALQRHLLRWHHIAEPRRGGGAIEETLDALTGVALPLGVWEHDILPVRVSHFRPEMLDEALASGHRVWTALPDESVAFWPRALLPQRPCAEAPPLSPTAAAILAHLRTAGASFQVDLELTMDTSEGQVVAALRELTLAGLISNDRISALAPVLAAVDPSQPHPRPRLQRGWWKSSTGTGGRWFILPRPDAPEAPMAAAERAADRVDRFLHRHGLACHELLVPGLDGAWRPTYDVLTRMEWAGSVRRGYFIEGLAGSQFALPGVRLSAAAPEDAVHYLAMLDPANLYAHLESTTYRGDVPGGATLPRIARVAGSYLAVHGGRPILAASGWGERLIPLTGDAALVELALRSLPSLLPRLARQHSLLVRLWNDGSVFDSPAAAILKELGFVRDMQGLRLYRSYAQPEPGTDEHPVKP